MVRGGGTASGWGARAAETWGARAGTRGSAVPFSGGDLFCLEAQPRIAGCAAFTSAAAIAGAEAGAGPAGFGNGSGDSRMAASCRSLPRDSIAWQ